MRRSPSVPGYRAIAFSRQFSNTARIPPPLLTTFRRSPSVGAMAGGMAASPSALPFDTLLNAEPG